MKSGPSMTPAGSPLRSWKYAIISFGGFAIGMPVAGTFFYFPTAVGYFSWPGLLILLGIALNSVICFVFCPRKPITAKLLVFALMVLPVLDALEWSAYDYLHIKYGS